MSSLHVHLPFFFFLILVFSSHQILAKPESKEADLIAKSKSAVHNALKNATAIYDRINMMLKKTSDKNVQKSLRGCSNRYDTAIGSIKKTLAVMECESFNSSSYKDVQSWLSAAITYTTDCDYMFTERRSGLKFPFPDMKAKLVQLCEAGLKSINTLAKTSFSVTQYCEQPALDQKLCKSTLGSFPKSKEVNLQNIAKFALYKAIQKNADIYEYIRNISYMSSDNQIQPAIGRCCDFYEAALECLEDSMVAFNKRRYDNVTKWAAAARSYAGTCEDEFMELNRKSPVYLTTMKTEFEKLVDIVLSLIIKLSEN